MTDSRATIVPTRRLVCAGCGTEFGCDLSGNCWCMEAPVALPMPTAGGDCLCRECLRKKAAARDQGVDS
jgi:hypothetical protein